MGLLANSPLRAAAVGRLGAGISMLATKEAGLWLTKRSRFRWSPRYSIRHWNLGGLGSTGTSFGADLAGVLARSAYRRRVEFRGRRGPVPEQARNARRV